MFGININRIYFAYKIHFMLSLSPVLCCSRCWTKATQNMVVGQYSDMCACEFVFLFGIQKPEEIYTEDKNCSIRILTVNPKKHPTHWQYGRKSVLWIFLCRIYLFTDSKKKYVWRKKSFKNEEIFTHTMMPLRYILQFGAK